MQRITVTRAPIVGDTYDAWLSALDERDRLAAKLREVEQFCRDHPIAPACKVLLLLKQERRSEP